VGKREGGKKKKKWGKNIKKKKKKKMRVFAARSQRVVGSASRQRQAAALHTGQLPQLNKLTVAEVGHHPEVKVTPLQLNKRLTEAEGTRDLLQLHQQYGHRFNDVNLATCWSRLGRARGADREALLHEGAQRLSPLCEQTRSTVGKWSARCVANIAPALARLDSERVDWDGLWEAWELAALKEVGGFDAHGLAMSVWALATVERRPTTLLDAIAVESEANVAEMNPHRFSSLAWGYAKSGHAAERLFDAIAVAAAPRLTEFSPPQLSLLAWAFAKASHKAPRLFDAIAAESAGNQIEQFNSQGLANLAWAYARAGHAAPALLDAIAKEALPRVSSLSSRHLVNLAWAFPAASHPAPILLRALAMEALLRVGGMSPRQLGTMAWALGAEARARGRRGSEAGGGPAAAALLDGIAAQWLTSLKMNSAELEGQHISTLVWGFVAAGHAAPALFDAVAQEAPQRLHTFTSQGLATTAWAFAASGVAAPELFSAIGQQAAPRVSSFRPGELSMSAWAFAMARLPQPELFSAIAAESEPRLASFSPQSLASTAWAFAVAGHPSAPALLSAIAAEAAPRLSEFGAHELSNIAWALAVADCEDRAWSERFAVRSEELAAEFSDEGLRQLHQWRLWHADERGRTHGLPKGALLERCAASFARRASLVQSSFLQDQLGEALESLGLPVQEEVLLQGGYTVDFVVEWRGARLVVEMDGPSHFLAGGEPTGATRLKRRQLRSFGCLLVAVPYWEWEELAPRGQRRDAWLAEQRRAEYVREKLETAVAGDGLGAPVGASRRKRRPTPPASSPVDWPDGAL